MDKAESDKTWDEKANCCCIGDDTCIHKDCMSPYGCMKCCVILPTRCCAAPLRVCGVDYNPLRCLLRDCTCGILCCLQPGFWMFPCCPTMEMLDVYAADGHKGLRTVNRLNAPGGSTQTQAPQIIMMQAPAPAAAPAVIINQAAPVIQQAAAPVMMQQPSSPYQQ